MLHEFNQFLSIVDADLLLLIKIGLLIAVIVLAQWLTNNWITRYAQRQQQLDITLLHAARRPLLLGLWLLGFSWIGEVLASAIKNESLALLSQIREPLLVILLAWFLIRVISILQALLLSPSASRLAWDASTAEAVGKVLKIIVVISALLMMMQLFGLSISGVLAFGGVGGIAIGFAAKDMLANVFGGLMIQMDKPFSTGDWIRTTDKSIEGVVEKIGWRMTRLRTFNKNPVYVPNGIFATIPIETPSRMTNRQIHAIIGIRYDDIDQMQSIIEKVEKLLADHEHIDHEEPCRVYFDLFNASSLDFVIWAFSSVTNSSDFKKIKGKILLDVADIIAGHGAEIAYPTQTLHIQKPE